MKKNMILSVLFLILCGTHYSHAKSPIDNRLIKKAEEFPANQLIEPAQNLKNEIPLSGTIRSYIRQIVHSNGAGEVIKSQITPCKTFPAHQCVQVIGEPCPGKWKNSESCEGMSLTVWVDVSTTPFKLDHAEGPEGPVKNEAEIEQELKMAP